MKEDTIDVFTKFVEMYYELLSFKDGDSFGLYGFGIGGPYNKWIKDVNELRKHDTASMFARGMAFGELEQLGFLYVGSRGKESKGSRGFNKRFKKAIARNNQK